MDTFWDAARYGRKVYRARLTIPSPSARFTELSDDDSVVAKFETTAADGIILKMKKATRLSGLAFTMVETRGIEPLTS